MRRRALPLIVTTLLGCPAFWAEPAFAQNRQLVVQVQGIRNGNGDIRISLYREAETFRKEALAWRQAVQAATSGEVQFVFENLPQGRYAIMVYHDENGDGRLNLRLGMFPIEGYALSNQPQIIGPPSFNACAFDFVASEESKPMQLPLRY